MAVPIRRRPPPPRGGFSPTFRTNDKSVPQRQNANRGPVGQQPQDTGLLGRLEGTVNTPLTFDNAPPIRDQPIIQPSTSPVDVPGAREATGPLQATAPVDFSGPNQATAPVDFSGPSQLDYTGQRVDPGQQFSGPQQYGQVAGPGQYGQVAGPGQSNLIGGPGQYGRYGMQAGPGVGPSQMIGGPQQSRQIGGPSSGRYLQGPQSGGFAGQGNSLEAATFQRGLNRINPQMEEQRAAMAQRLQNQGLANRK